MNRCAGSCLSCNVPMLCHHQLEVLRALLVRSRPHLSACIQEATRRADAWLSVSDLRAAASATPSGVDVRGTDGYLYKDQILSAASRVSAVANLKLFQHHGPRAHVCQHSLQALGVGSDISDVCRKIKSSCLGSWHVVISHKNASGTSSLFYKDCWINFTKGGCGCAKGVLSGQAQPLVQRHTAVLACVQEK